MALPAAVSALHSLSEDTGHASSATWALVRAEDYVAHLASSRYPLSIPGMFVFVACVLLFVTESCTSECARVRLHFVLDFKCQYFHTFCVRQSWRRAASSPHNPD